jgi:hypothetical protein
MRMRERELLTIRGHARLPQSRTENIISQFGAKSSVDPHT